MTALVRVRRSVVFGGAYRMDCLRCSALSVRESWPETMAVANSHVMAHRKLDLIYRLAQGPL